MQLAQQHLRQFVTIWGDQFCCSRGSRGPQVRNKVAGGFDLANMTLIEGDTGWIIVDPLTATETVRAAMKVVDEHLGKRPVKAILSSHSHADHFGGIRALANEEDLASGKIRFVAPENFVQETASENVIAGNAMGRRASYMFGNLLPSTTKGNVDSGLGKGVAFGTISLLTPTDTISATGQKLVLDGQIWMLVEGFC